MNNLWHGRVVMPAQGPYTYRCAVMVFRRRKRFLFVLFYSWTDTDGNTSERPEKSRKCSKWRRRGMGGKTIRILFSNIFHSNSVSVQTLPRPIVSDEINGRTRGKRTVKWEETRSLTNEDLVRRVRRAYVTFSENNRTFTRMLRNLHG